jgi:hypothetical protein
VSDVLDATSHVQERRIASKLLFWILRNRIQVYNHRMAQGIRQPAALAVFLQLCAIGPALPVPAEEPVPMVPRHNWSATASVAGTQPVLRVDSF